MPTKPEWNVQIPIAGSINITVPANTGEEALAAAWEMIHAGKATEENSDIEWEFLEEVVKGNCCYAPCTAQTATRAG